MPPILKDGGLSNLDWSAPKPKSATNGRHNMLAAGRQCRAQGCTRTVGRDGWGIYCRKHDMRSVRHGHPLMLGIKRAELAPYLKIVARVRKTSARTDWSAIEARWLAVVDLAKRIDTDEVRAGKAHANYRRKAAWLAKEIAENVKPDVVVDQVMAMYTFLEIDPGRFRSDDAFQAELIHVIRRAAQAGRVFHNGAHGSRATYRPLDKRSRQTLASWIVEALGVCGVHVAKLEADRLNRVDRKAEAYKAAVASIA